jgi:hypothetical protein
MLLRTLLQDHCCQQWAAHAGAVPQPAPSDNSSHHRADALQVRGPRLIWLLLPFFAMTLGQLIWFAAMVLCNDPGESSAASC